MLHTFCIIQKKRDRNPWLLGRGHVDSGEDVIGVSPLYTLHNINPSANTVQIIVIYMYYMNTMINTLSQRQYNNAKNFILARLLSSLGTPRSQVFFIQHGSKTSCRDNVRHPAGSVSAIAFIIIATKSTFCCGCYFRLFNCFYLNHVNAQEDVWIFFLKHLRICI